MDNVNKEIVLQGLKDEYNTIQEEIDSVIDDVRYGGEDEEEADRYISRLERKQELIQQKIEQLIKE